jgi:hypothetical protein
MQAVRTTRAKVRISNNNSASEVKIGHLDSLPRYLGEGMLASVVAFMFRYNGRV